VGGMWVVFEINSNNVWQKGPAVVVMTADTTDVLAFVVKKLLQSRNCFVCSY